MVTHRIYNIAEPAKAFFITLSMVLLLSAPSSAFASIVQVSLVDQKGAPLPNAVVSFKAIGLDMDDSHNATATIAQLDKEFVPEVTVVQAGTAISFPNNDDILHHVYSFSEAKTFDLPLYQGTPSEPVVFEKPGLVTLGCNIHDWMRAYVVVVDTPYYQISNEQGTVIIKDIAIGQYELEVWHPRQRLAYKRSIDIEAENNFSLEIATKPQLKSRRHSSGRGGGYNQ